MMASPAPAYAIRTIRCSTAARENLPHEPEDRRLPRLAGQQPEKAPLPGVPSRDRIRGF